MFMKKYMFLLLLISDFSILASCQHSTKPILIEMEYDKHIYLKAMINDSTEARLVLDSGADELLLDQQFFASTGIRINRRQQSLLPGAGTTPKTITVILDTMLTKIGDLRYTPRYVPLFDLRSILGDKADGVISPAFLQSYLVEIDYSNNLLKLHSGNSIINGFDSIKMEIRNNRYYLPVHIKVKNGVTIDGLCQLDLGNGGTLFLTSAFAQKNKLETTVDRKIKFFNVSGGAGGRIDGYQFRAASLQIGKHKLALPIIEWSLDSTGAMARSDHSGLLGNEILEKFRTIIDFKTGVLYLQPDKNNNKPFLGPILGFSYTKVKAGSEEVLEVKGLYEGSAAEKTGLQPGDLILAINGRKIGTIDEKQMKSLFTITGKKLEMTVKTSRQVKTVELELNELL